MPNLLAYIYGQISAVPLIAKDEDINKIIGKKLNLADPKLSKLLLNFIDYQYLNDEHVQLVSSKEVIKNFLDLKQVIFDEYEQKVKEYQTMKPWWQFWR